MGGGKRRVARTDLGQVAEAGGGMGDKEHGEVKVSLGGAVAEIRAQGKLCLVWKRAFHK